MKRLVDESTDELTRSLLVAGIEHRPPPGNRARVMMALGAGGALGLFSSNAFAWLGTTAGKVTAASVVVGIAGAALVVVPQVRSHRAEGDAPVQIKAASQVQEDGADPSQQAARLHLPEPSALPVPPRAGAVAPVGATGIDAERVDTAPSTAASSAQEDRLLGDPNEPTARERSQGSEARREPAGAARKAGRGRARSRKKEAARRDELAQAAAAPTASSVVPSAAGGVESDVAAGAGPASQPDLDAEVRLVDDMHRAVRRQDDEALGRFIERYRLMFPDGQLKKEVAEFAARRASSERASATAE